MQWELDCPGLGPVERYGACLRALEFSLHGHKGEGDFSVYQQQLRAAKKVGSIRTLFTLNR
jgi:hypothetical protein